MSFPLFLVLSSSSLHRDSVFKGGHPGEVLTLVNDNFKHTLLRLELAQLVFEVEQRYFLLIDLANQRWVNSHRPFVD